ncbi:putative isochorismatase domain-containing protein [Colletotrichum sublineola]|uniref:Putative isochorismatase domain-containing protein n=1 Tax=Colletotrichum sublineola TaxID=1173701 RepID=A0A066XRI9_COLSU|nr:putative isochorismatase domain-containing protein [Colletotrichum sublineola]
MSDIAPRRLQRPVILYVGDARPLPWRFLKQIKKEKTWHMGLIRDRHSVCDLQDKFRNAIFEFDKVVKTTSKLLRAAETLKIPVYTTTQNRLRLGDTVSELAPLLQESDLVRAPVDKTRFSMWVPEIAAQFDGKGPHEFLVVGIESHICVTQTALDLLAAGHRVYVLADGVSSCNREEVPIALARLRHEGVTVTTSESVLYEMMGDAARPEFKSIVGLVKDTGKDTKEALQALAPKI